jgi:AcrR family transcriptional regulator
VNARPILLAGVDLPREPRQKRSQAKRERLKEAALSLFGEKGYDGTSIEDVAREAQVAVGGFYQHFRSKRQLLLALMDDLLEQLSRLSLDTHPATGVRGGLHQLLSHAFSQDLRYLGAYRAWQEALLSDQDLAQKQEEIHAWTTSRVESVFGALYRMPGARAAVDIPSLAQVMDAFFWSLLARAAAMPREELDRWIDAATHLIFHAIFQDSPDER